MLSRFVLFLGLTSLVAGGLMIPASPRICADCNYAMINFTSVDAMQQFNSMYDEKCELQHSGYCSGVAPCACTEEYAPRCAWNGRKFKQFSNECELRRFNYQYFDRYAPVANCECHPDVNSH